MGTDGAFAFTGGIASPAGEVCYHVRVGAQQSPQVCVTVQEDAPALAITSLAPASVDAQAGPGEVPPIVVTGTGFTASTRFFDEVTDMGGIQAWGHQPDDQTSTSLTVRVPGELPAGAVQVYVKDGGTESNRLPFTNTGTGPQQSRVTLSASASSNSLTVDPEIVGTNPGASVTLRPNADSSDAPVEGTTNINVDGDSLPLRSNQGGGELTADQLVAFLQQDTVTITLFSDGTRWEWEPPL